VNDEASTPASTAAAGKPVEAAGGPATQAASPSDTAGKSTPDAPTKVAAKADKPRPRTGARSAPKPVTTRRVLQRFVIPLDSHRGDSRALYAHGLMFDIDRHSCVIPEHQSVSFGTYFNAFPAAYWRRWADLDTVRLNLRVRGNGKVTIFRSTSKGMSWPEQNIVFEGEGVHELNADLPLAPFIDGGWYWFEVLAFSGNDVVIEDGNWSAETTRQRPGRVSIGITTFNRPDYCIDQIRTLGEHDRLLEILDAVYVVDQGNQRIQDQPDFEECAKGLGDKLHVIEQGNLGGSGGFARAMYETLQSDESDYLLLLDDDVICEPEGIIRGATFADLARQPILVGGHMFSIFVRSVLHAWGEAVTKYRWMWGPAPHTHHGHDFGAVPLADTPWLHRRVDVDYNGWWMCLIPVVALKKIGLALPMFIKWDDADFGLRAGEQGFPTVSLPGVAVWHVPWHEKDDTIDWQAYFHERNRLLSALLHSPYKRGGRLPRESFEVVLKHALAMQYSPAEMILQAIEDLLEGPQHMHRDIPTKIDELREMRKKYDDARYAPRLQAYPPVRGNPPRHGHLPSAPDSKREAAKLALRELPRHFRPVSERAMKHPQAALPHADQKWWRLAQFDSVIVSTADGTGAAWLRRDPAQFRSIMRRSAILHARLAREWDSLAETYKAAVPTISGSEAWAKTFAVSERTMTPSRSQASRQAKKPTE
jgi:galactofuranosylgalactofuranosylrhamnosyl-N-acetylglucosaminyl-diphospho-decaprenol beta-1,5/1,6-galactofuranosyltransferase